MAKTTDKAIIQTDLIGARVAHMQSDMTPRETDTLGIVRGVYLEDGVAYVIAEAVGGRHFQAQTGQDVEAGKLMTWYLHTTRVLPRGGLGSGAVARIETGQEAGR